MFFAAMMGPVFRKAASTYPIQGEVQVSDDTLLTIFTYIMCK